MVDTGNYYPLQRDGAIDPIEKGLPENRWVEQHIQHPVIKAFNATNWHKEIQSGRFRRLALPVSGDDDAAKEVVSRLVTEAGFDPVDAGGLTNPGVFSPDRRLIARISAQTTCVPPLPKRPTNANRICRASAAAKKN